MKIPETIKVWLLGFCVFMVMCMLIFCAAIVSSCTSSAGNAKTHRIPEEEIMMKNYADYQRKIIIAYNHLLHRVWIDKPNYVEDALMETNEFCELDLLLNNEWADTFDFYNEEDSISYHLNWNNGDETIRVVKHVIPEPTKSRLKEIFGEDIE